MHVANEDIVWKTKKDILILLNTTTGHYYTLNQVASTLWNEHINSKKSLDETAETILMMYNNPPSKTEVISDLEEIIAEWKSENLIK